MSVISVQVRDVTFGCRIPGVENQRCVDVDVDVEVEVEVESTTFAAATPSR
jgi:hypothetical protein